MSTTKLLPNGNITVRVDYVFGRRGGRKKLLLKSEDAGLLSENKDMPILNAIARARRWQSYIDEGRFDSVLQLANALGLDRSYVSRTIRLAYLSPRIVRLFLEGKEPPNLTLTSLCGHIPDNWDEQEELFGIA